MSHSTSRRILPGRGLGAFGRDAEGSVAIEFAFVGLACFGLILEAMQAGFYFYTAAALDNATATAMRQVMTGAVAQQGLTGDQFRTRILCPRLPAAMPCASVVVNLQSVSEEGGFYQFVNAARTAVITPVMNNSQTSFQPGASGTVIYAQVSYAMPVFSPAWLAAGSAPFNGTPVHFVSAAAVFKNEPFGSFTGAGG